MKIASFQSRSIARIYLITAMAFSMPLPQASAESPAHKVHILVPHTTGSALAE